MINLGRRVITRQRAKAAVRAGLAQETTQQGAPQAPAPQSESSRLATIGQAQP
jgi:hypothetical protein